MSDDPINKIELVKDETILYEFILVNWNNNKLQIVEKTKVNKNTAQKYLDTLCGYDLIDCVEVKQGEKRYFPRFKNTLNFYESGLKIKNDFTIRKRIITNSLTSLNNCSIEEISYVYSKCIELVFSFQKIVKFTIYSNTHTKPIRQWLEFEKEIENYLHEITSKIPNVLFASVLENMNYLDEKILLDLEKFKKSKQKSLE